MCECKRSGKSGSSGKRGSIFYFIYLFAQNNTKHNEKENARLAGQKGPQDTDNRS